MQWIEEHILGVKISEVPSILPGLVMAIAVSYASIWFSKFVGVDLLGFKKSPISSVMVAIIVGMLINHFVPMKSSVSIGLKFCVKQILRLGIILLGIRLSIMSVITLGGLAIPIVLFTIVIAIFITVTLNNWLKLPSRLGVLIGVGTSICGVTAIVASSSVIEAEEEEIAYAVAVITLFGVIAMFAYPYLAYMLFDADPTMSGLFLGTAIHETSQVNGAGMIFRDVFSLPRGLDVAVITKLVRNVFMAAVIPLMALYYHGKTKPANGQERKKAGLFQFFPYFILGFLAFSVIRSLGDYMLVDSGVAFGLWSPEAWKGIVGFLKNSASNCMVVALAAVGLNTSFSVFKGLGLKPMMVGLTAAVTVGITSFLLITLVGTFVTF